MAMSSRDGERARTIDLMLRAVIPLLWLSLLGYQWSIASMVLDNIAQIVAQRLYLDYETEPAPVWGLLCDSYILINLVSWSLLLATCPRALTAIFDSGPTQSWAQRRLGRAVFIALFIGLAMQGAWMTAVLRLHGTEQSMVQSVFREVLLRFQSFLPWHWQLIALLPLLGWICVLVFNRRAVWSLSNWIGAGWAAVLFIEMNLAFGIGQARMAAVTDYGHTGRFEMVARFAVFAVVAIALVLEYRQVWQSAIERFAAGGQPKNPAVPSL